MIRYKRIQAVILAAAILLSLSDGMVAKADGKTITVTPFDGLWKYYGQSRTFHENEHFSLSEEPEQIAGSGWNLGIASEEVGKQDFILEGMTEAGDEKLVLDAKSPTFEIKAYTTNEKVEELPIQNEQKPVVIPAPKGYLISGEKVNGEWNWGPELETGNLAEGENPITYYLRSDKNDSTKMAIDQTAKKLIVKADSIYPVITKLEGGALSDVSAAVSISSSESAEYYYMTVPDGYSQEITPDVIIESVTAKYGIVGYGRVGKDKPVTVDIGGLTPNSSYRVYVILVDEAGNVSQMMSETISTDPMALAGRVNVNGAVEVDSTLTAVPELTSEDAGELTYQWYRIKLEEDVADFNAALDNTGGAEADDLEADYSDDDEDEDEDDGEDGDEEEDEDDEDGDMETAANETPVVQDTSNGADREITSIDGATEIKGAVSNTYKVTKEDIGYRLIACVTSDKYSGYVAGSTAAFVPKLVPAFTTPVAASALYSPTRKLSSIKLPEQWSWVDDTIVPVYGNSGYRAKFVPADTSLYRSVIVRVKVPVTKKTLKKSMVKVTKKKTYTGKTIKDNFTVKDSGVEISDKNYKVTYWKNKNPGKATITFKGRGNYKGTVEASYTIVKKSVKNVAYHCPKTMVYTGKERKAEFVLKNGNVTMKKKRDYTFEYKNNKKIGRASIVIKGKGNYRGKRVLHFLIVPKKPAYRKIKVSGKNFRVYLGKKTQVRGFYIDVSTSPSFAAASTKKYIVTGNSFGIKGAEKGMYYVRARAYSVKNGVTCISSNSAVKKIRIKK